MQHKGLASLVKFCLDKFYLEIKPERCFLNEYKKTTVDISYEVNLLVFELF